MKQETNTTTRMIRPKKWAYLGFGLLTAGFLAALAIRVADQGPYVPALPLMALVALAYAFWCWLLCGHALIVSEKGITLRKRLAKDNFIAWSIVEHSTVPYLMGRSPLQILIRRRATPSIPVTIPLKLYALEDIKFLLNLPMLRLSEVMKGDEVTGRSNGVFRLHSPTLNLMER